MFMRYQLGMSVGHVYMHAMGAFPPPKVPSIPPDFDHCLDIPPLVGDKRRKERAGGSSTLQQEGQAPQAEGVTSNGDDHQEESPGSDDEWDDESDGSHSEVASDDDGDYSSDDGHYPDDGGHPDSLDGGELQGHVHN